MCPFHFPSRRGKFPPAPSTRVENKQTNKNIDRKKKEIGYSLLLYPRRTLHEKNVAKAAARVKVTCSKLDVRGKLPSVSRQRCLGEGGQLQVLLTMARTQISLGLHSPIVIQESGIPFCEFLGTFTKEFKGQLRRKAGSRGTILFAFERKTKGQANCKCRQLP